MKSSSEEMRSKLKAFKFDDADRRSRPGGFPLHHSNSSCNSINNSNSHLRFASSIIEQESKLNEIMSHTGLLQTPEGNKVKAYIEDFELLGDLGNGTCGHVVKMQHRPTGQIIAVKQMRRTGDADENKRIIMDLDVVLKSHDCREIVLCLGAFITDSDVWICMELMSTCFDKLLKHIKAPIPEDICGKVAVATVNALNYLKERHGVIHRDVKPSNILLEASGCVKLCDFGISGRLVDSKAKTRSAGCAAYMAPERIDPPNPSQPDYDIRADVWSLGITLVELATGYFPYRDCKTDFEVLTKVLTDDPPLLPRNGGFSHEFRSFVKDCLMKNYNDRPKYKKLLTHPFILKYEEMDVDVGAWYRNKTEPHEVNSTQNVSPSTATVSEPVTFKPQPSPRVVRSSRRPPQSPSGYPSAMSRLTASPTVSTSSITTSNSAFDPTSIKHHYDSRRYPSNGGTSSYSSLLNTSSSSNRSPQYLSSSSGPTSLPEVLSRPSITPRYRESPRMPRKFDFTFPTTLYSSTSNNHTSSGSGSGSSSSSSSSNKHPGDHLMSAYISHNYMGAQNSSTEDRSGYPRFSNRMHHHHRPSLGGEQPSSLSKNNPRSPSNERASTTPGGGRAGIHSNVPSSSNTTTSTTNSGSGFSWRNILQSPMSLRRLRTSSTDRSSAFDSARRFQPSYRSWNNEKDNYFSSMKR
uniref:mitogen-activated protein kinase kinase n=1 Tax=Lepeophtheirus salmonis TaxID=72036 RepID=A0A0K2T948_LEPSM